MRPTRLLVHAAGTAALTVVSAVALLAGAVASASAPTHVPGAAASGNAVRGAAVPGSARAAGPATGAVAATEVQEYVALGDSYTAGPLIPQTLLAFGCLRSTHNYPALLAAELDAHSFVDVSCSGADTTGLTRSQQTGFGAVPPQLSGLSPDTDLVTIGMGGNDFGVFGRLVQVCRTVRSQDPDGDPCRDHFRSAGGDALLRDVARTRGRLVQAVEEVTHRAPDATVVVVGYPRIVPPHGTCPSVLPFADRDYRYADRVERRLNAALRHAAEVNDATYVDTYRASRGHDGCAGEDAWVNGATADPRRAQSYHPVRAYMDAVAGLVLAEVGRADAS